MRRTLTSVLCASAIVLGAAACSDDDDSSSAEDTSAADESPSPVVSAEDVELVGDDGGFASQTLDISAEEVDGEVTGEFRISDNTFAIRCADTGMPGVVILGGEKTAGPDLAHGDLVGLVLRDGAPDAANLIGNDTGGTCTEMLDTISRKDLADDDWYTLVEAGSDIEFG